jgi:hypothetical protein
MISRAAYTKKLQKITGAPHCSSAGSHHVVDDMIVSRLGRPTDELDDIATGQPGTGADAMMQQPTIELPSSPYPAYPHLGVIREMLDAIETTTIAGQRYVMSKVGAFLRGEVGRARGLAGPRRRAAVQWLDELAGQAERMVPDVDAFNGRAKMVVGMLRSTGR